MQPYNSHPARCIQYNGRCGLAAPSVGNKTAHNKEILRFLTEIFGEMAELEKELFPAPAAVTPEIVNKPPMTKPPKVQRSPTKNAPQIKPPTTKEEPPADSKPTGGKK